MNNITIGKAKLINGDCMEFMRDIPDNYYELAIVDRSEERRVGKEC